MEPNNFEKDFREKLNQHTIEPSDKSWDRLDAMLSIAEKKTKPKNKNRWLFIAASIVGFLLVGTFFFTQNKNKIDIPQNTIVVKENVKSDTVVKPVLDIVNSGKTEVVISEKTATQNAEKEKKNLNPKTNKTIKNESNQIAESSIIKKNNQEKQSINSKISVAETPKKETVDQLLEAAEKSVIAESSVKPKSKVKINANDLLNQVDGELELSFREKVITKVNKNYQTVKVALANRNQQE